MPRITLALSVALSLVAAPALAQIGIQGSVLPSSPNLFPTPDIPLEGGGPFDPDGDGLPDFIETAGNRLLNLFQLDPTNPAFNAVADGVLAFNSVDVWRGYDTPQNILVGDSGASGTLSITAGGVLRYQHLVLGGVSQQSSGSNNTLDLSFEPGVDFDVANYLAATDAGQGGSGTLIVSGAGSTFNNDPNQIPADLQAALNLGLGRTGEDVNQLITNLGAAVMDDPDSNRAIPNALTTRVVELANQGFDLVVGLNGSGRLQVDNGGLVEIQDALMVGVDEQSTGDVVVDGAGTQLIAFGRFEFDNGNAGQLNLAADVESSTVSTSFIGGRGRGTLAVSGGGRADFRNGLSIGAPTGNIETVTNDAVDGNGNGSGRVEVVGAGSVLNAFSSAVDSFDFEDGDGQTRELALAVGDIRENGLNNPFNPTGPASNDTNLQTGELVISGGATVNVLTAEYGGTADEANALVGKNGSVVLAEGSLLVGDELLVDGDISGYGTVQAGTLDTSTFSVIRGGNPNSENAALADPLRLVVNDVKDRGAIVGGTDNDSLINRGLIDGVVDITSTGRLVNEGDITVSGEVNAGSITTTVASTLVGARSGGAPLRVRVSSDAAVASGSLSLADETSGNVAFQNNGLLDGEVDVIVTGAFFNGTNQSLSGAAATNLSNGGVIRASGSIRAGVFLNHRLGVIEVGRGETLSILAIGEDDAGNTSSVTYAGLILEDGVDSRPGGAPATDGVPEDADFNAANLGTINVIGGTLDTGVIVDSRAAIADNAIDHFRLFRNARVFDAAVGESIGTINANDAQINFREGVYNTGVIAFTGGANTVTGRVFNAGTLVDVNGTPMDPSDDELGINFGTAADPFVRPGVILVSGQGAAVTFADNVVNNGVISVGPLDNVANFLGDLVNNGEISVAVDPLTLSSSAFFVVAGDVELNGGFLTLAPTSASAFEEGFRVDLIDATSLTVNSSFSGFDLPTLADGLFWEIALDEVNGEVRAEVIASIAEGADFTGDGVVDAQDLQVWIDNAGILTGASSIQGDADLDGDVDLDDFTLLQQQLLTGVPAAAIAPLVAQVPEPSAALLLVLAACGFAKRRR